MKLVDNYEYLVETKKSRRYECAVNKQCLCLSTADSDFRFPKYITEDVAEYMSHGDLNYSFRKEEFKDTINYWYKKEYGNKQTKDFKTSNIIIGNGVINFLQLAIRSFSNIGDGIIFFSPVYYSFQTAILNLGRKVQKSKLIFNTHTQEFEINFEEFENLMKKESNKIFLFCSPHNPIGKV
jgi:bifunctional pyridoxal-dependent enzyme with beta-cystathionase and maltose regulon repressor activities